jgi:hypothetical protein
LAEWAVCPHCGGIDRISKKPVIAEAIRYALHHWDGLTRFLDDGRIELDTKCGRKRHSSDCT